MRGISLVLIDPRRRGVDRFVMRIVRGSQNAIGAGSINNRTARQRHEVRRAGSRRVQWIVRLQRNEDRSIAALGDKIEAVVEELAEERHPAVELWRQADVRRLV